jgi:hypothetical protein
MKKSADQKISVRLTLKELETILAMADNQLFRIKYIDSKVPGHINHPEEQRAAQSVVQILKDAFKSAKGFTTTENGHLKEHNLSLKRSASGN